VLDADGPEAGLAAIEVVRADPRLARYHLLGAVHGDMLARAGRHAEAADVLERAAQLAPTQRERSLLMERAAAASAQSTAAAPPVEGRDGRARLGP
jgi:predicted RNA polymerase sigma factor